MPLVYTGKPVRNLSLCASSKRFAVKLIKTTETQRMERYTTHTHTHTPAAAALLSHGPISLSYTHTYNIKPRNREVYLQLLLYIASG